MPLHRLPLVCSYNESKSYRTQYSTILNRCQPLKDILHVDCQWFRSRLESFQGPGDSIMPDRLRTLLAKLIVQQLNRPRPLVIRAWLWQVRT